MPDEWKKAIIVPCIKVKVVKMSNNYRGISLLSVPGKVYGNVLTERLMEVTTRKVSEKQEGFRKGKGYVNQIFAIKIMVEEYLRKGEKLYAAFMDLEETYDRVHREALWNVRVIFLWMGVRGK